MRLTRRVPLLIVPVVLFAGCGGDDTSLTERALEAAAGAQGEDVDVELSDDGGFSIETDDGSLTINEGQQLPDDFPSEVPLLDGWTATLSSQMTDGGQTAWVLGFVSDADASDTFAELRAAWTAAGFSETSTMESGTADGYGAIVGAEGMGLLLYASIGADSSGDATTSITLNVSSTPSP